MNAHTCQVCQDTGMTRSGHLDCMAPGCNAAVERAAFNDRLKNELGLTGPWVMLEMAWSVRNMLKADGKEACHAQ